MADIKGKSDEKEIKARIKKTEKKLRTFFGNLPEDKQKFIEEPLHQLAVTQVTLERLAEEINSGEVVEIFVNGSQKMRRENPALKSYNATVKSYTALFKQLADLLPPSDNTPKAGDALMAFIGTAKVGK